MDGTDVRAWVDTDDEKVDPPKVERKGKAKARARVELAALPGFGGVGGGAVGSPGGVGAYKPISEKEWKELAKDLKFPPDCDDLYKLGRFLQAHGGQTIENSRLGFPPMPAGGERSSTSWHYKCGNSGAIDLNYAGNEKAIIDSQIGWFHKLGFNTLWQVDNHFDHIHINPGAGEGIGGTGGGAAGPLQHTALEVKLIDWEAVFPAGFASGFVGGAGGIPFGPPDPKVAAIMCHVLDQMNVSAKVRLAAWETAIVESGVKNLPYGDADSHGVFQQQWTMGWGTLAQTMDPAYATRKFVSVAQGIERATPTPACSPRRSSAPPIPSATPSAPARPPHSTSSSAADAARPELPARCGARRRLAVAGCGGGDEERASAPAGRGRRRAAGGHSVGRARGDPAAAGLRPRRQGRGWGRGRSASSTSRTARRSRRGRCRSTASRRSTACAGRAGATRARPRAAGWTR